MYNLKSLRIIKLKLLFQIISLSKHNFDGLVMNFLRTCFVVWKLCLCVAGRNGEQRNLSTVYPGNPDKADEDLQCQRGVQSPPACV